MTRALDFDVGAMVVAMLAALIVLVALSFGFGFGFGVTETVRSASDAGAD